MLADTLEHAYIIWLLVACCSGGAYMSADMLGVRIYIGHQLALLCSGGAYMSADMLGACIYYMAIVASLEWGAYMSADILGARMYYMAIGCARLQ